MPRCRCRGHCRRFHRRQFRCLKEFATETNPYKLQYFWSNIGLVVVFGISVIVAASHLRKEAPQAPAAKDLVHGAWCEVCQHADPQPKLPAPHFFTHPADKVTCKICSSSGTMWDACNATSCDQTDNDRCIPFKQYTNMTGNYTGCMCSWHFNLDALTAVTLQRNVGESCILRGCDTRGNICGDGCCRSFFGTEQVCGKTMYMYPPSDWSSTYHRIPVCLPVNATEDYKRRYGVCFDHEFIGRDCSSPDWRPCCEGMDSCSRTCHSLQWKLFSEEALEQMVAMVATCGALMLLSWPCFWRRVLGSFTSNDCRVAVVICCSKPGLKTAVDDGKAFANKLRPHYDKVILLVDDQVTPRNIFEAVKAVIAFCANYKYLRPLFVFYFAGHCTSRLERDPVHGIMSNDILQCWDSIIELKDVITKFLRMHTLQGMRDEIRLQNAPVPVRNACVIFILDCCQTQVPGALQVPLEDPPRPRQGLPAHVGPRDLEDGAAQIGFVWAARFGERALDSERPGERHSPFTYLLLDYMENYPVGEMFQKIKDAMATSHRRLRPDCLHILSNFRLGGVRLLPIGAFDMTEA